MRYVINISKEERSQKLNDIIEDKEFKSYAQMIFNEIKKSDSYIPKYWLSYLEMVEILLMHYQKRLAFNANGRVFMSSD